MDILNGLLKKKNAGILIGAGFVLLAIPFFVYIPMGRQIKFKTLEWIALKNELNAGYRNLELFQRNGVNKKMVSPKEVSAVIENITKEGKKLMLNFKSISQREQIERPEGYSILPVEMQIEGQYKQLGEFLGCLEAMQDALVAIDNFKASYDEKIAPKLSIVLTLNIYIEKG